MADPTASIEEDWRTFSSLTEMTNHWQREGWWPGRTGYYWYVTFEDSFELHELVRKCQSILHEYPGYDLTPIDSLHMTLDRVGFEDEVSEEGLRRVAEHVELLSRELPALSINVGPLAGSAGALNFSVTPRESVDQLRKRLSAAIRTAVDSVASEGTFRPHVGIAYHNSEGPARPIIDAVAQLRELPRVHVVVKQVALVRLTREERAYRWNPQRTFPFGG